MVAKIWQMGSWPSWSQMDLLLKLVINYHPSIKIPSIPIKMYTVEKYSMHRLCAWQMCAHDTSVAIRCGDF